MSLVDDDCVLALWQVTNFVSHKRKFLKCSYDDRDGILKRLRQLPGVLIDLLNDARFVLELIDGVLKLLVQDKPVGYDNNRVKYFYVFLVVEI